MVINRQRRVKVDLTSVRGFAGQLRFVLRLGKREFNVCLVDDAEIKRLNAIFRDRARSTDVLAFGWRLQEKGRSRRLSDSEFGGHLGDVAISAETARRNAIRLGHSTAAEIKLLILHGVLHLLGYDHEVDCGEMRALEQSLMMRLGGRRAMLDREDATRQKSRK